MHLFKLFIDRIDIYILTRFTLDLIPSLVTLMKSPSGKDGRLVTWRPYGVAGSNPTVDKFSVLFTRCSSQLDWQRSNENIAVCKTQMPPFPNIRRVGLTFDLDF